jgi:hypothetical protein
MEHNFAMNNNRSRFTEQCGLTIQSPLVLKLHNFVMNNNRSRFTEQRGLTLQSPLILKLHLIDGGNWWRATGWLGVQFVDTDKIEIDPDNGIILL